MNLPLYEIPASDELHLNELRTVLHNIGRYALMKTSSAREGWTNPDGVYQQHGQGLIVDRGGGPALYTLKLSEWHVTSWITGWERGPSYTYTFGRQGFEETINVNVIKILTENSIYELRY